MNKNKMLLVIYILVFIIIIIQISLYLKKGNQVIQINEMYKDIELLEDKIALYYLDNEKLPIKKDSNIEFYNNSINPNDNKLYYEIDLEKLDNMQLSYGNGKFGEKDIYIINEQSHTIYYYKGIEYQKNIIHTKNTEYEYVDLEKYQ